MSLLSINQSSITSEAITSNAAAGQTLTKSSPQSKLDVIYQPKAIRGVKPTVIGNTTINSTASHQHHITSNALHSRVGYYSPHTKADASSKEMEKPEIIVTHQDLVNLRKIALQLICALWELHKEGIIHGDIKPENCFIDIHSSSSIYSDSSSSSSSSNLNKLSADHASSSFRSNSLSSKIDSLKNLPQDFVIKLGDFGNSLHTSECYIFYEEFQIQSLPYRAPEVLIGLPFQCSIDTWSVGILLIELFMGKPLFTTNDRLANIQAIENKIGKLSKTRFSGGKFSYLLYDNYEGSRSFNGNGSSYRDNKSTSSKVEQMKNIKRLLMKGSNISSLSVHDFNDFVDFVAGLTVIDPDFRTSPQNALQHPFLVPLMTLPMSLIFGNNDTNKECNSKTRLKRKSSEVKFDPVFQSLTPTRIEHQQKSAYDFKTSRTRLY